MEPTVQRGYLVLADVSGYTSFLAGTELIHAQAVLQRIMQLMIDRLTPVLVLGEVEGDAVFAFADEARLDRGETLLELIESTYVAFRDEQRAMCRLSNCACKACEDIPTLNLKFVTHFGEYILQDFGGKKKPMGSSVNLAHRLLKNTVKELTGWQGYALFTQESLKKMEVHPEQMHRCTECYEHLGDVDTETLNLDARYEELTSQRSVYLSPADSDLVFTRDIAAPVPLVWDWINDPHKRVQWWEKSGWHAVGHATGRNGRGSVNHCSTSNFDEYVLDWRPFSYFSVERKRGKLTMTITSELEPIASGTRLHWRIRLNVPLPGWMRRTIAQHVLARVMTLEESARSLKLHLEDAATQREWRSPVTTGGTSVPLFNLGTG